jgi:hypothetical protein
MILIDYERMNNHSLASFILTLTPSAGQPVRLSFVLK